MVREVDVVADFIALSGGFDPLHCGHTAMIADAACFGKVIILLNSDDWLMRKKGYVFMKFEERKRLLQSLRDVYCVLPAQDDDNTVCKSIDSLKDLVRYFGNGGDRKADNTPEAELCQQLGIPIIYGLGGNKISSSSELVTNAIASGA